MNLRLALCACALILSGCVFFDQRSDPVAFHQLRAPAADASRTGPAVFVTRAELPVALRRPNVVLVDDQGWGQVEDAHRWIAPLDRAIAEAVARHLTRHSGLPGTTSLPAEPHLRVDVRISKMHVLTPPGAESAFASGGPAARVALLETQFRLVRADGRSAAFTCAQRADMPDLSVESYVRAQSANLAKACEAFARRENLADVSRP
ncbi:MAG: membrane integrity-associated transporter subunit PqiC [Verrucomicrobiota bacterium]